MHIISYHIHITRVVAIRSCSIPSPYTALTRSLCSLHGFLLHLYPTIITRQASRFLKRGTTCAPFTALPLCPGQRADFLGRTVPEECQLQVGPCRRYVSSRSICLDDVLPVALLPCRLRGTAARGTAAWPPWCPRLFASKALSTRFKHSTRVCPGYCYLGQRPAGLNTCGAPTIRGSLERESNRWR